MKRRTDRQALNRAKTATEAMRKIARQRMLWLLQQFCLCVQITALSTTSLDRSAKLIPLAQTLQAYEERFGLTTQRELYMSVWQGQPPILDPSVDRQSSALPVHHRAALHHVFLRCYRASSRNSPYRTTATMHRATFIGGSGRHRLLLIRQLLDQLQSTDRHTRECIK